MTLQLRTINARLSHGLIEVVRGVTLTFDPRQITVIVGPNGSGKSTLLAGLAGLLPTSGGGIELGERVVTCWHRRALARELAFLPQTPTAPAEIRVRDMVSHGRFTHRRPFMPLTRADHAAVDAALAATQTTAFADRPFGALSGGERQRIWIALALAQSPRLLLLDEPTSFLDIGFQFQTLDLLRRLNRDQGHGIIMVLHDINQASWYADRVIALKDGRVIADGTPEEVVTPANVAALYGITVEARRTNGTNARPFCIPAQLPKG